MAIMNGVVSLIPFSVCLPLVDRKATGFCVFILYPASLLKYLSALRLFLWRLCDQLCNKSYLQILFCFFPCYPSHFILTSFFLKPHTLNEITEGVDLLPCSWTFLPSVKCWIRLPYMAFVILGYALSVSCCPCDLYPERTLDFIRGFLSLY